MPGQPPTLTIRRTGRSMIALEFDEDIRGDLSRVEGANGEIPVNVLTSIVDRAVDAGRVSTVAAGCNDKCTKDCLW